MTHRKIGKSFRHAGRGFAYVFSHEKNFRIHVIIAIAVFIIAGYLGVSPLEFAALVLVSLLVLVLEIINSAVERLIDVVSPRLAEQIRIIKDMLAGMVLLASLGAVVVGLLILLPAVSAYFLRLSGV